MNIINDLLLYMASGVIILGFLVFLLNFITKGFFMNFLKVRGSQGKKVMISIQSATDRYYRASNFDGEKFSFKNRTGEKCLLNNTDPRAVYSSMGVYWIDYNEVTKSIVTPEGKSYPGIDLQKMDSLLDRAIQKPAELDKRLTIMLILSIVMIILVVGLGFILFQNYQILTQILAKIGSATVIK